MEEILYEHHRLEVDKGQQPMRIDTYISQHLPNITRTKAESAIEEGYVFVNEKTTKASYKVKPNDIIVIKLPQPKKELKIVAEDIPIDVVYEDDDLIVVNKKAGMVVHPAYGHYSGTLVNALASHLTNSELFVDGDIRPGLVHRIDKDTTGLLVIAKTEFAKIHLARQFFEHTVKRQYNALVWGNFEQQQGTIIGNVGRHPKDRKVMYVFADGSQGKHAVTHWSVLESFLFVTLVECHLETGRTHQIRVHMKYIGHPLFNDADYGGNEIIKGTKFSKYEQFVKNCFKILPRQALHAKTLGFVHPRTKKELFFETTLPEDMFQVIDKWRNYTKNSNFD